MRYGIFSDVHSNLEAFVVAIDYFKNNNIDRYIFVGDIVGYGANPEECIYCLRNLNSICIVGNHDWAVTDKFNIEYFNTLAKEAIIWTKKQLSTESFVYLNSFELLYKEDNFICVHGSLYNPQDFNYIFTMEDIEHNFSLLDRQVLFIGHSHSPVVYINSNGKISYLLENKIKIYENIKYIINIGSVGQPRDRDNRACVCIYDSEENVVILERLRYNFSEAAEKIIRNGLPKFLAYRLYEGI